jgi:hypothetical protein
MSRASASSSVKAPSAQATKGAAAKAARAAGDKVFVGGSPADRAVLIGDIIECIHLKGPKRSVSSLRLCEWAKMSGTPLCSSVCPPVVCGAHVLLRLFVSCSLIITVSTLSEFLSAQSPLSPSNLYRKVS